MTDTQVMAALEPTQADREAAATWMVDGEGLVEAYRERISRGDWDNTGIVQAFARHRLASSPIANAPVTDERELREKVEALIEKRMPRGGYQWVRDLVHEAVSLAALSSAEPAVASIHETGQFGMAAAFAKTFSAPPATDARATLASPSPASSPVAREVMTLVIAARAAWEEMQDLAVSRLNLDNLDRALEAFSSRVPYENEPKGATASSPVGEGDNALLNTARRNIRTFINGASFKCSADKEAALACVDVLESNLSQPTPASARDNQAIWDALRDFTLADGRTLESFFVKGNDKINFCCLIASLSPLSGEPASVAVEAVAWMYAREDGERTFEFNPNGESARWLLENGYTETPLAPLSKPTPVETIRQKQARDMMNPKSGSVTAPSGGQSYNALPPKDVTDEYDPF